MTGSDKMTKRDKRSDGDYQRAVGDFVNRQVIYCVSNLIYEIGMKNIDEWHHLFRQEDWETPALEAIRAFSPEHLRELLLEANVPFNAADEPGATARTYLYHLKQQDSLQEFCYANRVDPEQTEIYEHWIVSDWLAARLEERGEVIERHFYGLTIWGRACTGQAILLDNVICSIYDEVAPRPIRKRLRSQSSTTNFGRGSLSRLSALARSPAGSSAHPVLPPFLLKRRSAHGERSPGSTASPRTMIRTANTISERSTSRASARSSGTTHAPSALKTRRTFRSASVS